MAEALGDTGRILVRESSTEPLVRVMVEAPDHDTCQKYVSEVVDVIRDRGSKRKDLRQIRQSFKHRNSLSGMPLPSPVRKQSRMKIFKTSCRIQRLRTEKNQVFQPVKKDTDNLQAVMNTVGEAGDVMHLSQNVVETFIDRIEVFNDERVKIRFTFEDALNSCEEK